jgi:hypothetical protein
MNSALKLTATRHCIETQLSKARSCKRSTPKTVADLIEVVSARNDISRGMRINLRCCLHRFAELCGRSPSHLPADPAHIRALCQAHINHCQRISRSRAKTIRSALGAALQISGIGEGSRPRGKRLSREYGRLLSKLRSQWDRYPLQRFLRYCSDRHISPCRIDKQTFDAFEAYVEQRTLVADPRRVAALTRSAWNRAAGTVPGWPQVLAKGDVPRGGNRICLTPRFASELADYVSFMEGKGPSPSGEMKRAPYRPSTIRQRSQLVTQFGNILACTQRSPSSLSDLVDPSNAATILNTLRNENGVRLQCVYRRAIFLRHLAKVWCRPSAAIREALLQLERKFIPPFRGRAERSYRLSKILFDQERQNQILLLPKDLMKAAQASRYHGPRAALKAQIAAAIELMLVAPLWPCNLARLSLGKTVVKERVNRRSIYRISIPRSEVHNDTPLEYILPSASSALIDRYVVSFRRQLCGPSTHWLFPGRANRPKQTSAFSSQITGYIHRATGIHVTMSSLRYFVGAIYLIKNPGAYEVVRQAFGHKSLQTTYEMYAELDTIEAVHRFDQRVLLNSSLY